MAVNGVSKVNGLDVFAMAGFGAPYDVTYTVTPVNGKIIVDLTATLDNAIINGIQITLRE